MTTILCNAPAHQLDTMTTDHAWETLDVVDVGRSNPDVKVCETCQRLAWLLVDVDISTH